MSCAAFRADPRATGGSPQAWRQTIFLRASHTPSYAVPDFQATSLREPRSAAAPCWPAMHTTIRWVIDRMERTLPGQAHIVVSVALPLRPEATVRSEDPDFRQ